MRDDGTLEALYKRWWEDAGSCSFRSSTADASRLSFSDLVGLFYLLLAFFAAALVVLLLEIIAKYQLISIKWEGVLILVSRKYLDKNQNARSTFLWHLCDDGDVPTTNLAERAATPTPPAMIIRPSGASIDLDAEMQFKKANAHSHQMHAKAGLHNNLTRSH